MSFLRTRREFLVTGAAALAAAHLGARGLSAAPRRTLDRGTTGAALLPEPMDDSLARRLAAAALDAARAAGAAFADVRIGYNHELAISNDYGYQPRVLVEASTGYGIRVIAGGAMAFVYGRIPTVEAAVAAARDATATAKGLAKHIRRPVTLAPAPVVTGEWETPVKVDPFLVPIEEQAALIQSYVDSVDSLKHLLRNMSLSWNREMRVYASTDGSMITQRTTRLSPGGSIQDDTWRVPLVVPGIEPGSGGYELLPSVFQQERFAATGHEVARLSSLPRGTLDVGRYDVVMDGGTMALVLLNTLGPALELDRALGDEVGASGTSIAMPPNDVLGTPFVSSLVSLSNGEPATNGYLDLKWDDDGVACRPVPLIQKGELVNYCSTRTQAPTLASWYARRNMPVASTACARVQKVTDPPLARPRHLTMAPAAGTASVDELCRNVTKGILVRKGHQRPGVVASDQQGASFQIGDGVSMFEISRGEIVRQLENNAVYGATATMWRKSIKTVGGAGSVAPGRDILRKGQPVADVEVTAAAPAAHFIDMNVINLPTRKW